VRVDVEVVVSMSGLTLTSNSPILRVPAPLAHIALIIFPLEVTGLPPWRPELAVLPVVVRGAGQREGLPCREGQAGVGYLDVETVDAEEEKQDC